MDIIFSHWLLIDFLFRLENSIIPSFYRKEGIIEFSSLNKKSTKKYFWQKSTSQKTKTKIEQMLINQDKNDLFQLIVPL